MSGAVDVSALLDLEAVARVIADAGAPVSGPLTAVPFSNGRSNITIKISDGEHAWVVRRPPAAGLTPSAHDVGREYRVTEALLGTTVPVPATVVSCTDLDVIGVPFTVVDFVDGVTLQTQDELAVLDDAALSALWSELIGVLIGLHEVPYAERGLAEFGRPTGFAARQVKRWRQQWDHVATRELPDVDRLFTALTERIPADVTTAAVVHGDYRVDNVLLDSAGQKVLAVIDWEMSTLGDPLTDVATMCAYQHPAFDHVVGEPAASTSARWPSVDDLVQEYAVRSGRDVSAMPAYLGLGYFKLAVISEGITSRYLAGAGGGPEFAAAALAVPDLIAAGLDALRRTS